MLTWSGWWEREDGITELQVTLLLSEYCIVDTSYGRYGLQALLNINTLLDSFVCST